MAVDRTRLNPIDDRPVNDIELSEQEILNKSFDRDYNVLANEILVLGADNRLKRQGIIATETTLQSVSDKLGSSYAFWGATGDANHDYIAKEDKDGNWQIMRIAKSNGLATYAIGASNLTTNWANRVNLTYLTYSEVF